MALAAAERILEMTLPPGDPNYMALLTRQQSIIASVLSATARVTPGRLRGQEVDHMDAIVAEVRAQRALISGLH
jgi:hypothetical protein